MRQIAQPGLSSSDDAPLHRVFAVCWAIPAPKHSAWRRESGKEQMLAVSCRAVNFGVDEMTIIAMMTINAVASTNVNLDLERFMSLTQLE
jgi:hypothetical protein